MGVMFSRLSSTQVAKCTYLFNLRHRIILVLAVLEENNAAGKTVYYHSTIFHLKLHKCTPRSYNLGINYRLLLQMYTNK